MGLGLVNDVFEWSERNQKLGRPNKTAQAFDSLR